MSVSPQLTSSVSTLTQPYLWVVGHAVEGEAIAPLPADTMVGDRFRVVAPHLWLDTQPETALERDLDIPEAALPYLHLYTHRLHIPEVYGVYATRSDAAPADALPAEPPLLLLSNVPVDDSGELLASLPSAWEKATAVRQLYWLWQMGQLWEPLLAQGRASSLLDGENVRVEGWRIRLCELVSDHSHLSRATPISLRDLGDLWMTWAETAQPTVRESIRAIAQAMQQPDAEWGAIAPQLNQHLLEQAAQLPLRLDSAGGTIPGAQRNHNEDACYPVTIEVEGETSHGLSDGPDDLRPRLAMVCDGIGSHSGGEVASQLVIRALKLQLQVLVNDLDEQDEIQSPDIIMQQLEAAIRVVNNLVSYQNDEQGRQSRQRMGTTLVMALQLPQTVETPDGNANAHELYIAQVGDCRAYWLTPRYCHALTIDDDVASREVQAGRSFPREAARRSDAIALTQALGTRQGEYLHIHVQRFVVEEDGVLLLCSDGLSDNQLVERSWQSVMANMLRGKQSLNHAVEAWLKLADQHNGHDNIAAVMMRCRVSKDALDLFDPTVEAAPIRQRSLTVSVSEEAATEAPATQKPRRSRRSKAGRSSRKSRTPKAPQPSAGSTVDSPAPSPPWQSIPIQPEKPEKPEKNNQPTWGAQRISKSQPPEPIIDETLSAYLLTTRSISDTRHPNRKSSKANVADLSLSEQKRARLNLFGRTALPPGMLDDEPDDVDELTRSFEPSSQWTVIHADEDEEEMPEWNWLAIALGLAVVMFIAGAASIFTWRRVAPDHFDRTVETLVNQTWQRLLPLDGTPEAQPGAESQPPDPTATDATPPNPETATEGE